VPPGFIFSIKVPNSITLTHHYSKGKGATLVPNPHFLSTGLMARFLQAIEPLGDHIGPLMFQFEYLNKQKMGSLHRFLELFEVFRQGLPAGFRYCVEIRNPNWLRGEYFDFLAEHGLAHVFLQGYYMPPIFGVYWQNREKLTSPVVIRLQGSNRDGMEERTGNVWNRNRRTEGRRAGRTGHNGARPAPAQPRHLHQRQQPLRGFSAQNHRKIMALLAG